MHLFFHVHSNSVNLSLFIAETLKKTIYIRFPFFSSLIGLTSAPTRQAGSFAAKLMERFLRSPSLIKSR